MDWNDRQRVGFVLAHEIAHIRRVDGISKGLLAAALCIRWFYPMVWVMYVFANRDLEQACDEAVLQKYGSSIKAAYALALVGMEEKRLGFATAGDAKEGSGASSGEALPYTQEQYDQLIDGFFVDGYENMFIAQFNRTIYEKFSNDEALGELFYTYADMLPENDPYGAYLNMTVQASLNEYESCLGEVYSGEAVNPQVYRYFQKVVQADVFGDQVPAGGYYVEYMFSYRILDQDHFLYIGSY